MNVNEVYKTIQLACAKNTAQGYISPDDFNLNINIASKSFAAFLIGEYQQYQAKRPIPVVAFGENERVRTSLAPLIYEVIIPVNSTTGIGAFPYGFIQVDAMWGQYGFYNIRFTEQDRLMSNYRSVIDPVQTNPVYLIRHEGFQFFPETIGNVRLSYIQNPPSIMWGYTPDVNELPVYNPATSLDPIWDDIDIMEVIVRCLDLFGVNLQFNIVREYAMQIKKGGQ